MNREDFKDLNLFIQMKLTVEFLKVSQGIFKPVRTFETRKCLSLFFNEFPKVTKMVSESFFFYRV